MQIEEKTLLIGGDVPATVTLPVGAGPHPAILLLHGTASQRDEVGGMYAKAAPLLAQRGIASLRIDFAGCGASERPQTDFTVGSELADARAAFTWLSEQSGIAPERIGVLGFSQGGMIAALLAGAEPRVAALAVWSSGIVESERAGFEMLAPLFADGGDHALVDLGFRQFTFSRTWWDEIAEMDLAAAVKGFGRPLLAVAGSADTLVPPSSSLALIRAADSADVTFVQFPGADHIFNSLDPETDMSTPVVETTADWFAARLASRSEGVG